MGTIFVAYGDHSEREQVLAFAAERAAASGDDLFVYHVAEADESPAAVREEITAVVERTAPDVEFEAHVSVPDSRSDRSNVSKQKQLLDVLTASGRDFEYAVMGNVERGPVQSLVIPSMTEAVLESRAIPVVLVPV